MTTQRNRFDEDIDRDLNWSSFRPLFIVCVLSALAVVSLIAFCSSAHADQLALIHTGCAAGALRSSCTSAKLDVPKPDDLVAPCPDPANCWKDPPPTVVKLSAVPATTAIDGCNNPAIKAGTGPSWEACGNFWKAVPASAYGPTTNTTGTISLSWNVVTQCIDHDDGDKEKPCTDAANPTWAIKGYRVFSGVKPDALTLLRAVDAATLQIAISGYGDGTYYFAVQAYNADAKTPDGPFSTPPVSVIVKKPVTASARPKSVSGVAITVTF